MVLLFRRAFFFYSLEKGIFLFMPQNSVFKQSAFSLLSIILLVPIGFYSKLYKGPAAFWVNNSLSGVFYEIFWCVLFFAIFPNARTIIIASAVLIITCLLEFMQLWHPRVLEMIRSTFLGQALLGNSFTWSDFPYYFAGCGIGWVWMQFLKKLTPQKGKTILSKTIKIPQG